MQLLSASLWDTRSPSPTPCAASFGEAVLASHIFNSSRSIMWEASTVWPNSGFGIDSVVHQKLPHIGLAYFGCRQAPPARTELWVYALRPDLDGMRFA